MSQQEDKILGDIRDLASQRHFKEFIWLLLDEAGVYNITFTGNAHTYFAEGKRSMGLFILQLLEEADPTLYPRMLLERQKTGEFK